MFKNRINVDHSYEPGQICKCEQLYPKADRKHYRAYCQDSGLKFAPCNGSGRLTHPRFFQRDVGPLSNCSALEQFSANQKIGGLMLSTI